MLTLMLAMLAPLASAPVDAVNDDIVVRARYGRPLNAPIVSDRALAAMRGGIRISDGFDISLGVDIQTRVDGVLVLHTIYTSDGPAAGVRVFTDGTTAPRTAPGTVVVSLPESQGRPAVIVDRSPTGTTVVLGEVGQPSTVNLVAAEQAKWLTGADQTAVPVNGDGTPVTQGPGTFQLATGEQGTVVTLDTAMLQIRHLIGQATGVVIANTANDRSIDTISSINVDLQGLSPAVMAGLFTADALAFDAMSRR